MILHICVPIWPAGEGYDWYYANQADRIRQNRRPITDGAHGEHWIFRPKDLTNWWTHRHHPRRGGIRSSRASAWQPRMKPIRLMEIGYPAIDRGGNAPNLFFDPKSSESAWPPFSDGTRDDLSQRRTLAAALRYWQAQPGIEQTFVWAWDGRPWPHFPVRQDIWADGPNWRYGHWLNGRSGLIEIGEIIADLARQAAITVDTSALSGFVEGFVVDNVSSLRAALAPLTSAFKLECIESQNRLIFRHQGRGDSWSIGEDAYVQGGLSRTHELLDKRPDRLILTYISGQEAYQPALVEVRQQTQSGQRQDNGYPLHLTMPLVMQESQAKTLAARLLADTLTTLTGNITLGPTGLGIKAGDRITLPDSQVWQVTQITDENLQRQLTLVAQATHATTDAMRAVEPGDVGPAAIVPTYPRLIFIDGPPVAGRTAGAPLICAHTRPWPGQLEVVDGGQTGHLGVRAIIQAPCVMGFVQKNVPAGPVGRWDEKAVLDVFMIEGNLTSAAPQAVLNGANQMLVRSSQGWELLAWREAELIRENRWLLRGLLRGLNGSPSAFIRRGYRVVLVDETLVSASLSADEIGLQRLWQVGNLRPRRFTFNDIGGLPWPVAHLAAHRKTDGWHISWTRRGRDLPESWALPEADNQGRFRVEAYTGQQRRIALTVSSGQAHLTQAGIDRVQVAEIGADGRYGRWRSIQLTNQP